MKEETTTEESKKLLSPKGAIDFSHALREKDNQQMMQLCSIRFFTVSHNALS